MAGFAFPLPFTVICELLGIPEPDRADLGTLVRAPCSPRTPGPEPPAEAVAASETIVEYLTALLDRKRTAPGEDLVTDLVNAADRDGALTEQEMLSTIFQLVVAGHDTTTSLIGNGTVALLRHPEQRDALVADPALVPRAIEECLRWDAPVPHSTFRYTTEDVRIGGVVIPAYAQVIVSLAAANRDPARYRDRGDVRHPPDRRRPPRLRPRHPLLPRRPAGPDGGAHRAHRAAHPLPRDAPRRRPVRRCTGATATGWCCAGSPSSGRPRTST